MTGGASAEPMTESTTRMLGYADRLSVAPGERLEIKLSCRDVERYRLDFVRIVCGDPDPRGPGLRLLPVESPVDGEYPGRFQPIDAGSYVRIDDTSGFPDGGSFAVGAFIWPTAPGGRRQTVLGWWSEPCAAGFALEIDERGRLRLRLGGGAGGGAEPGAEFAAAADAGAGGIDVACAGTLLERRWHFAAASHEAQSGRAHVAWTPLDEHAGCPAGSSASLDGTAWRAPPDGTPLLVGAHRAPPSHGRWMSGGHYDGKVEGPVLAGAALAPERLRALAERPSEIGPEDAALGAWDFTAGIEGTKVTDRGPDARHGRTVNLPARGVTGRSWDGSIADWRLAPEQYGAIHFHEDDLHDCGWATDVALEVPAGWESGFYAARMRAPGAVGYVAFFVRPPNGVARAPIALVASTATYMSYANTHIKFDSLNTENLYEGLTPISEDELHLNEHRELGLSHYDTHADGSGVFYASRLRPMLNVRPGLYTFNYLNDTHVVAWLAARGFDCDVITDEDIHEAGADLLSRYRVVITGSHPEYVSTRMWDAFDAYQRAGGRHMYLGGNGFYWRIAFSDEVPGVIENRRGITGVRTWEGEPGEHHLSFTGEPGGLWRSNGRPPQRLVGVGFSATIFNRSTYYRRTEAGRHPRYAFVFEGVGEDERIGDFGLRGGGAVGMEIDRWDPDLGAPPASVVLATSQDVGIGGLLSVEEFVTTTRALDGLQHGRVRADMVFFETPGGGAVWSTGSIAWATSLASNGFDNNVSRITENVLRRFLDPRRFDAPPGGTTGPAEGRGPRRNGEVAGGEPH